MFAARACLLPFAAFRKWVEFGNGYRFKNSSGFFSLVLCDPLMILSAPHIHVGTAETRRTFQSGDEGGGAQPLS